jgi:uncharacterized protein YbjT (DUF2867 family)
MVQQRGVASSVILVTGATEHPTHDLRLVQAARRAGVRHIVKLSVYSGGTGDDAIDAWHREAEAAVMDSGIDWTLLRPGRFQPLGRPPTTFAQWAAAHAGLFTQTDLH